MEAASDGGRGDRVEVGELHEPTRQEPQRPAGAPLGRGRAGRHHQQRLLLLVQQALAARPWLFAQGRLQALLDEALPGSVDRRDAAMARGFDGLRRLPARRHQEDVRPLDPSNSGDASPLEGFELFALRLRQVY